jgi:hypothetical protein
MPNSSAKRLNLSKYSCVDGTFIYVCIVLNNLIALRFIGQLNKVKITSGRIVILISYMTSLVLLAAYSAFLISSLAVQPRVLPFRDLQGLLRDGSYRISVEKNSYIFNVFDVRRTAYLWTDYLIGVSLGVLPTGEGKHELSNVFVLYPLTTNCHYSGRTAPLTSRRCILNIYSTISVLNILNVLHNIRFSLFKMPFIS